MGKDDRNRYVFNNLEDILVFVQWLHDNFKSTDEYELWFDHSLESVIPPDAFCARPLRSRQTMLRCSECGAQFSTKSGLEVHNKVLHKRKQDNDEFWQIVNNAYTENNEDHKNDTTISDPD